MLKLRYKSKCKTRREKERKNILLQISHDYYIIRNRIITYNKQGVAQINVCIKGAKIF